ncbi:hypothetical protein SAMN05446037_1007136 [Anaerovirgula multivorans]|uniref:Uncharacterized protein n=1 Tax=Anaerovirgula multivorans TaxID=312168 RepID=A0A239DFY9_9FIRM|nr:hypothetical protein [Anaerovirgula multivorans]SNS30754.1 hypothetical protein SAMN05446037_1007136 [Anaerovirgula multivorans]
MHNYSNGILYLRNIRCKHISVILIIAFFVQILFLSGILFTSNHVFAEQTGVDAKVTNALVNQTSPLQTDTAEELAGELPTHLRDILKSHPRFLKSSTEGLRDGLIMNDEQRDTTHEKHLLETEDLEEEQLTLLKEEAINKTTISMGDGTPENPYQIWTAEDLNNVRYDLSAHYIQMADIDLSGYRNWQPIWDKNLWIPFTGTYDGNFFSISNLKIESSESFLGLFGACCDAILTKIKIINTDIIGTGSGFFQYAGILCAVAG